MTLSRMLDIIKDEKLDNITKIQENIKKFEEEVINKFGFVPENTYRHHSSTTYKLKNPIPHPHGKVTKDNPAVNRPDTMIYIKDWDPSEGEILFFTTDYGQHNRDNQQELHIDEFIKFVNNLKNNPELPFPKETNEHYTNQIINNIINNIIQENVHQ